jgi:hypothetical protein
LRAASSSRGDRLPLDHPNRREPRALAVGLGVVGLEHERDTV